MNLFALVASFGGGIIGAYMGALPAFILTGVIAIAGSVAAMAGGADMTVGFIAFGSYLGPHIAFAGGVAASAYAGRTKKLGSGTDILSCLNGLADPATLLVGGVFGVIGFLIHYLIGTVLHLNTDLPGFTVILSAVIARLVFGSGGLIGGAGNHNRLCVSGASGWRGISSSHRQLSGTLLRNSSCFTDFCPDRICHAGNTSHCSDFCIGSGFLTKSCYGYCIWNTDLTVR